MWKIINKLFDLPDQNFNDSKSGNSKIIELNKFIVQNDTKDEGFWEYGAYLLVYKTLMAFDDCDWNDLFTDLKYWKSDSLGLLIGMCEHEDRLKSKECQVLVSEIFISLDNLNFDLFLLHLLGIRDAKLDSNRLNQLIQKLHEIKVLPERKQPIETYDFLINLFTKNKNIA